MRSAFEMLVLRMISFRPARAGEYISEAGPSHSMPDAESNSDPEPVPQISAIADTQDVEALIPYNVTDNAMNLDPCEILTLP